MPETEETPAPKRKLSAVRLLLGTLLVAAALALILTRPRPDEIALEARVEPSPSAPGRAARLVLSIAPGPGAPPDARLENARVAVLPASDLEFARNSDFFLHSDEKVAMDFTVAAGAAPGEREIEVLVEARLVVEGQAIARPAVLRRRITLTIGPPEAAPPAPKEKPE